MTEEEKMMEKFKELSAKWGSQGGKTTMKRYGKDYLREIGRKGGLNKGKNKNK